MQQEIQKARLGDTAACPNYHCGSVMRFSKMQVDGFVRNIWFCSKCMAACEEGTNVFKFLERGR